MARSASGRTPQRTLRIVGKNAGILERVDKILWGSLGVRQGNSMTCRSTEPAKREAGANMTENKGASSCRKRAGGHTRRLNPTADEHHDPREVDMILKRTEMTVEGEGEVRRVAHEPSQQDHKEEHKGLRKRGNHQGSHNCHP